MSNAAAKPVLELRAIQYNARMSEETSNYAATLYVDGEKWGTVGNDGHGGCDRFHGEGRNWNDVAALNERIKATYEPITLGSGEQSITVEPDLETLCGEILGDHLIRKQMVGDFKSKVVFQAKGESHISVIKMDKKFTPETYFKFVAEKYEGCTILNTMPVAEAFPIYKAGTAG